MNKITSDIYKNFKPWTEDLQGWNGTKSIFKELIQEVQPKSILEVGTWKGQSAITMGKVIKELKLNCTITCVDTWLGAAEFWVGDTAKTKDRDLKLINGFPSIYYQFLSNVIHNELTEVILPFPVPSSIAAEVFRRRKEKFDLIYIDGSHEYEDVMIDCKNFFPLLNKNGVMFGDDYNWESVKNAIIDSVKTFPSNSKWTNHTVKDDFWIVRNP